MSGRAWSDQYDVVLILVGHVAERSEIVRALEHRCCRADLAALSLLCCTPLSLWQAPRHGRREGAHRFTTVPPMGLEPCRCRCSTGNTKHTA